MATELLIKNLQKNDLFEHPCESFKVIETHISWVLLTGSFVYKIKKPLDLGFLDYSSLEKRQHYCQEELRLNRLYAPEIYIDVVAITGTENEPKINGDGPVIEYAVKMHEFPQTMMFDQLLEDKQLTAKLIEQSASALADFHSKTAICPKDAYFGKPEQILEPVQQNFDQIKPFLSDASDLEQINRLERWSLAEHKRLKTLMQQRKDQGWVKECHGDAHLGNITLINDKPVFFDCIEFNDSLSWTDVMADLGFLVMDLEYHNQHDFATLATNRYLQETSDYQGLAMLDYYKIYRAIVRGKVNLFHWQQASDADKPKIWQTAKRCFNLAEAYTQPKQPFLLITQGVTSSGKSTLAQQLVTPLNCICISSDRVRKHLVGLEATAKTHSGVNEDLYSFQMHDMTYKELKSIARDIIQSGYGVIVDASFIKQDHRFLFRQLADKLRVPFKILHCHAAPDVLQQRLAERMKQGNTVSEAYQEVLEMQLADEEAFSEEEQPYVINIDMNSDMVINDVINNIKAN